MTAGLILFPIPKCVDTLLSLLHKGCLNLLACDRSAQQKIFLDLFFWLLGKTGPETRLNHKSLEGNCLSGKIWHHKLYGFLSVIFAKQRSIKPQFLRVFKAGSLLPAPGSGRAIATVAVVKEKLVRFLIKIEQFGVSCPPDQGL